MTNRSTTHRGSLLIRCVKCGSEAFPEAMFCHNCGTRLSPDQVQQLAQAPSQQGGPYAGTYPLYPLPGSEESRRQWSQGHTIPPRKSIGKAVLVTSIVAILLAFIILGAALSQGWIDFDLGASHGNQNQATVGNCTVTYSWLYLGTDWTITETISNTTYLNYRDQPKTYDYPTYVTKTDPIVIEIAQELKNDAGNRGYNTAQFILSFVQNIPYGTDENTTGFANYPRYPVETLVDGVGDCKDHSTLYASLMESQAVNADMALLVLMPGNGGVGHMAAGLCASGYSGTYFQDDGKDYYYCETTSPGWIIGQLPPEVAGYIVTVLPLD